MPWNAIAAGIAKVAGTGAAEAVSSRLTKQGIQLFQEYAQPWIKTKINRTYAERYLSLTSSQLCNFYSNEKPLTYNFGNKVFQLPMSLVISPTSSESAENEKIKIALISKKYEVSSRIAMYTIPLLERLKKGTDSRLFDGEVVRLQAIDNSGDNYWNLTVAQGSYFEALATNFAMDHCPSGMTQSLRELLSDRTRVLGDISKNPLVNHIGIVCMVESTDGMLVVQKRSAKVANRPGSLSSSVSGVLDWKDIKNEQHWSITGLARGTLRESFEELGVHLQQLWFLGLVREYLRGGKPEFYFFAKSDQSYHEIEKRRKTARGRFESKGIVPYEFYTDMINDKAQSKYAFYDRVIKVLEKTGKEANLTLVAGICLTAARLLEIKSGEST